MGALVLRPRRVTWRSTPITTTDSHGLVVSPICRATGPNGCGKPILICSGAMRIRLSTNSFIIGQAGPSRDQLLSHGPLHLTPASFVLCVFSSKFARSGNGFCLYCVPFPPRSGVNAVYSCFLYPLTEMLQHRWCCNWYPFHELLPSLLGTEYPHELFLSQLLWSRRFLNPGFGSCMLHTLHPCHSQVSESCPFLSSHRLLSRCWQSCQRWKVRHELVRLSGGLGRTGTSRGPFGSLIVDRLR